MYTRHLDQALVKHFEKYREILVLLGARQTGKTTLLKRLFPDAQYLLVDNEPVRQALESYDINVYRQILKQEQTHIVIDKIQLLTNPGRCAKIIYDQLPEVKLVITGSSSLHIKNKTGESLAGRKRDYYLFPLTFSEYLLQNGIESELNFRTSELEVSSSTRQTESHLFNLPETLDMVLLYGLFPQMVNYPRDRQYLENFGESLIFKDLLELDLIDNRRAAYNLLKLLAYQTGNLINYSELAGKLRIDQRTVRRYLEIFEQSFIIFTLYPFSQRQRDEIVKSPKIYFWDTGLRNALIGNFDPLELRPDAGALFENFIVAEYRKNLSYQNSNFQMHYWRTKQGAEIDLVLSQGQELLGREIKFSKQRASGAFAKRYPQARVSLINSHNFY